MIESVFKKGIGSSPIHKLNGLTKIFSFSVLTLAAFISPGFRFLFLFLLLFLLLFSMSNLKLKDLTNFIKRFWFFALITFLVHILFPPESKDTIDRISKGSRNGLFFTIRLFLLFAFPYFLFATTSFEEIRLAVEKLFRPLRRFSSVIGELGLILVLSIRFLYWVQKELEEIREAQLARGITFKGKGLKRKINALVPLFVPTFISAIKKSERVAMALQLRGYEPGKARTSIYEENISVNDVIFIVFSSAILVITIYLAWS